MGYTAVWNVLEEMLIELRKKELSIPPSIMEDLRSAKTIIQMLANDNRAENLEKVEQYLLNVESYLVSEGQTRFGVEYIDGWLKRIDKANKETDEKERETRFIPGISRQQKWVRIAPSEELTLEKLKPLAERMGLTTKIQKDGSILVTGEEQRIKNFVKRLALNYKAIPSK